VEGDVDFKDYYQILGVARDASQDEIQKAYRKLARKYHPDVNKEPGAETRFKELNEAAEVLKDPEKRAKYDRFGSAWNARQQGGSPPPGFEQFDFDFGGIPFGGFEPGNAQGFSNFFEMLFGSGARSGPGGPFRSARGRPGRRPADWSERGADQEASITLTLEQAARGGRQEISVDGTRGERRGYAVQIPPGIRPGKRIRLAKRGEPGSGGGEAGDLYLRVELAPHPRFRLEGDDLHTHLLVTPWEAALGGDVRLRTLDGEVTVRVPPGSSSGRRIRLRGRGFPRGEGEAGDLYAEIRVAVPEQLGPRERELYEELSRVSSFDPRR
jgi:curved DNA-binding protein